MGAHRAVTQIFPRKDFAPLKHFATESWQRLGGASHIRLGPIGAMTDTVPMDRIVTLAERKAAEAARRNQAVAELRRELQAYASAGGGRYLLFGSAARGEMRYDSDVDILVEFPPEQQRAAWSFAERACWKRQLTPDVMASAWCTEDFLTLVLPTAEVLGE